jgi:hypothetical protein
VTHDPLHQARPVKERSYWLWDERDLSIERRQVSAMRRMRALQRARDPECVEPKPKKEK